MVYWHYAYPSKGGMPAGGLAAYDSATHFLGSYGGTLTLLSGTPGKEGKCLYPVVIHNTSGWTSGTRLPGFAQTLAETIKKKTPAWVGISGWNTMSLFKNHARGRYDLYPLSGKSKGGNYDQVRQTWKLNSQNNPNIYCWCPFDKHAEFSEILAQALSINGIKKPFRVGGIIPKK